LPGPADWQCSRCDHVLDLREDHAAAESGDRFCCSVCKNHELYRKKDFPHGFGLLILTIACAVSFVTYGYYEKWLTWTILIGTAIFDGLLYLCVGDAIVCYRCNAHYRGVKSSKSVPPHDLGIAERYRQERIRHGQF
jgi:hypothetical protein